MLHGRLHALEARYCVCLGVCVCVCVLGCRIEFRLTDEETHQRDRARKEKGSEVDDTQAEI